MFDVLFTILGILVNLAGQYFDYAWTMALERKGWLNMEVSQFGQVVLKSRERRKFFMKNGQLKVNLFIVTKILLFVVPVVIAIWTLVSAEDRLYVIAPFMFNLIVGIVHLVYGLSNRKNYHMIEEVVNKK